MKPIQWQRLRFGMLGGTVGFLLGFAPGVQVRADVFTIDTNQSAITISGSILGYSFAAQGQGSLTATYSGTIQAAPAAGAIQFTGQSAIQALNNGSWQPKSDGTTGNEPANYGAQASAGFATAKAALRNLLLDVTSPAIPVVNGQFGASSLTFGFPTNAISALAYNVTGLINKSGATTLTGYATNNVVAVATLTSTNNQQILTIPVDATFVFTLTSANDTTIELKGQLVAVRASAPTLTVGSIAVQNQVATLQWQGTPGQAFQVHSSTDLTAWQTNAANVTSTSSTYTWTGPVSGPKQFFRLAR